MKKFYKFDSLYKVLKDIKKFDEDVPDNFPNYFPHIDTILKALFLGNNVCIYG